MFVIMETSIGVLDNQHIRLHFLVTFVELESLSY